MCVGRIRNIEHHASDDVEKMILGNKCDVEEKRVVTKERGEKLAQQLGVKVNLSICDVCASLIDIFFFVCLVYGNLCKVEH